MKGMFNKLFVLLSFGVIISFCIGILSFIRTVFPNQYLHYKMYRLLALSLQSSLNQYIARIVLLIICIYVSLVISILFLKKLSFPFIKNTLAINVIDKAKLIRLICSTVISLFFLIYDGWLVNWFITINWSIKSYKILIILFVANTMLLPIAILVWFLLIHGRWEKLCGFFVGFGSLVIKLKNPFSKTITIIAIFLFMLLMFLNTILLIDGTINVPQEPNIILISIDTLGAKHLKCYGYKKDITPNVDKFSKDAVLFRNCIAQAPYTHPSHASLFTSLIPEHHGVMLAEKIPTNIMTIAEILKNYYYSTISFNGGAGVAAEFGFNRGFDIYESHDFDKSFEDRVESAQEWIKKHKKKFFLFLHTYEVHTPYSQNKKYLSQLMQDYRGKLPNKIEAETIWKIFYKEINIDSKDLEYIIDLYDAGIMSADHAFGRFIDFLKENDLYDNSLIIFTSDHGEEFNEHGIIGLHTPSLNDEVLRVPLIIKFPKSHFKDRIIDETVRSIDILPTILSLLNLKSLEYFEGVSILPLLQKAENGERFAISQRLGNETYDGKENEGRIFSSIRTNQWKWRGGKLFNLKNDPDEKNDVVEENQEIATFFENKLNEIINSNKLITAKERKTERAKISDELREKFKALGYLQ